MQRSYEMPPAWRALHTRGQGYVSGACSVVRKNVCCLAMKNRGVAGIMLTTIRFETRLPLGNSCARGVAGGGFVIG